MEYDPPAWLSDAYRRSENLLVADDTSYRFMISAVMCCSATFFREIGGFDESFTRYGGEDWEMAFRAYNAGAVLAHAPLAVAWHDGPDWAERGDPTWPRQEQAGQRRTLARLLPESVRDRSPEEAGGPAELVVVWTGTAAIEASRLGSAVRELIGSSLRPLVHLDPGELGRAGLKAIPRVCTGPPPAGVLARALDVMTLTGDCEPAADDLVRVRDRLRSGAVGRVHLHRPGSPHPVLTGLTLRAVHRAARWQAGAPEADLVEAFFGHADL